MMLGPGGVLEEEARSSLAAQGIEFTPEALKESIERGDTAAVQLFIHGGMALDIPVGEGGETPLSVAVRADQAEVVALLLRSGARADVPDASGRTVLMQAIWWKRVTAIRVILDAAVPPDTRVAQGRTALMMAAAEGEADAVAALIEHGAKRDLADDEGMTALMLAARSGHAQTVEVLARAGADISPRCGDGLTALELALRERHADAARMLKMAERGELVATPKAHARALPPRDAMFIPLGEGRWWLAWLLGGVAALLTVVNLGGWSPIAPKLPSALRPPAAEAAKMALRFAVEEIESFRASHGHLPESLAGLGLGDTVSWRYAVAPGGKTYSVTATVSGVRVTFDSSIQLPSAVGADVSTARAGV
jgi:hypothetical protein